MPVKNQIDPKILISAIEQTGIGIFDWDMINNSVSFSDEWKNILGYQPDEIVDAFEEWKNRLHPDEVQEVMQRTQDYIEGKLDKYEQSYRMKHKSGEYIWVLGRGTIVSRDETGNPTRMIGTNVDVTMLLTAEAEKLKRTKNLDDFKSFIRRSVLDKASEIYDED